MSGARPGEVEANSSLALQTLYFVKLSTSSPEGDRRQPQGLGFK